MACPAWAENNQPKVKRVSDMQKVSTHVADLFAQEPSQSVVQVMEVKLNPTVDGIEIILETQDNRPLQIDATKFRTESNALIADIPNAVLALPQGQSFRADNPAQGITQINVIQLNATSIRVSVAGDQSPPTTNVVLKTGGLAYSLNPEGEEPDEEIVVTGEGQRGYRVPNASTATKTDTPLRDIPQSIQVIPQQVIQDQRANRLVDAIKNAPGVVQGGVSPRTFADSFLIRGFNAGNNALKDGLLDLAQAYVGYDPITVDRIEVLKGPASVLFGQLPLGGVINIVTKQPLREPYYFLEGSAGIFNFYRGAIDLSGPVNADKTVLYRLGVAARTTESFVDFYEQQRYNVAPSLTWQINDRAKLTLAAEYYEAKGPYDLGIPAEGTVLPNRNGKIPRDRFIGEPSVDDSDNRAYRVGYNFEYRFSDNWQVRSAFRASFVRTDRELVFGTLAADQRTFNRTYSTQDYNDDIYNFDTYVVGKFGTGSVQHQLVTGFNLSREDTFATNFNRAIAPLDLFNPQYGSQPTEPATDPFNYRIRNDALGIYVQDQIALADNLKVLLGGRFDIASNNYQRLDTVLGGFQQDEAFSPRVSIIYQPIPAISLYASYSKSFFQAAGTTGRAPAEPERGTQYEVGIKADLSSRLTATLAFYDLTRTNLPTPDPNNPLFTIQVGEQRSRGIEFDITGEILPGWNIIAGYALTDAQITEDNTFTVGNQLNNVPKNALNLWTTYQIQSGSLQGLGFGLGFYFAGERQGDLANTFELPSYFRTDAAIFYRRGQLRAGLNFKNLFNIDYFESAQSRNRVFYGDPFTVQGTISWEF